MIYKYGTTAGPFVFQEMPLQGILKIVDEDPSGNYYSLLYYGRKLTESEVRHYKLAYLGEVERL